MVIRRCCRIFNRLFADVVKTTRSRPGLNQNSIDLFVSCKIIINIVLKDESQQSRPKYSRLKRPLRMTRRVVFAQLAFLAFGAPAVLLSLIAAEIVIGFSITQRLNPVARVVNWPSEYILNSCNYVSAEEGGYLKGAPPNDSPYWDGAEHKCRARGDGHLLRP